MSNFKEDLNHIKAFIFDVDGVLTDNKVYVFPDNDYVRAMNVKDGWAIQYAIKQGYIIGIITGGDSQAVKQRLNKLGVTDVYLKCSDKLEAFRDFHIKYDIDPVTILYMGDDVPDIEVMRNVGMPTCPRDAVEEVRSISKYISDYKGGKGCVRDVIEQVLKLHGKWPFDGRTEITSI